MPPQIPQPSSKKAISLIIGIVVILGVIAIGYYVWFQQQSDIEHPLDADSDTTPEAIIFG